MNYEAAFSGFCFVADEVVHVAPAPVPLPEIRQLAAAHGWEEIGINAASKVISFRDADCSTRLNVYYTTMTVGSALLHPVMGKTQLFRRDCSKEDLQKIFDNPRVHTKGKGYQLLKQKQLQQQKKRNCEVPPTLTELQALNAHLNELLDEVERTEELIAQCECQLEDAGTAGTECQWGVTGHQRPAE
jgi:hypothetical protein